MIKKVSSWILGSFFRQFGRFLFFLVLGGLVVLLVQHNNINFKWTDLLGIETIKADTMYLDGFDTPWYDSDRTTKLSTNGPFQYRVQTSSTIGSGFKVSEFYTKTPMPVDVIKGGEFIVPLYVNAPIIEQTTLNNARGCYRWDLSSQGNWFCASDTSYTYNETDFVYPSLNIWAMAVYTSGYTDMCTIDLANNKLICPVANNNATNTLWFIQIRTIVYYNLAASDQYYYVGLGDKTNRYKNVSQSIIDNQNQNTQDINNTFTDTNTTSDVSSANSFFNNTSSGSENALASIVSTPFTLLNNLATGTYSDICATLNGKNICLPSGRILWNRDHVAGTWFRGGTLQNFIDFFNLVVGGFILYKCLLSLFNSVHKMLDPVNTYVEVMKL